MKRGFSDITIVERVGPNGGAVAVSSCPGKHYASGDLQSDLEAMARKHGVATILSLMPEGELSQATNGGYQQYRAKAEQAGIELRHLSIRDLNAPDKLEEVREEVGELARQVEEEGRTVNIHCRGGIGRAPMIACCLLLAVKQCSSADEAIQTLRRTRTPMAVETSSQEEFVNRFARLCSLS